MQKQITTNVKDHIKEVMKMALKNNRAKLIVPKTLLRMYMLELKLQGIAVTLEGENELYIDWSDSAKLKEQDKRAGAERKLLQAAKLIKESK